MNDKLSAPICECYNRNIRRFSWRILMYCSVKRTIISFAIALFFCAIFPLQALALEDPGSSSVAPEVRAQNGCEVKNVEADSAEKAKVESADARSGDAIADTAQKPPESLSAQAAPEGDGYVGQSAGLKKEAGQKAEEPLLTAQQETKAQQASVASAKQFSKQKAKTAAPAQTMSVASTKKYETPLPAGTYMIATANSTTRVLDVAGGSKSNGTNVLLWDWHNATWQKWEVTFDQNGLYTITNVHSGKVLDVSGAVARNGSNVLQWSSKSTANLNQRWILEKSGTGFILKSAINQRFVLDCTGNSAANGTNVEIWTANKGNNQCFNFVNLAPTAKYEPALKDGVYIMGASKNSAQRVEVQGYSPKNTANVDLYAKNSGLNQQWSFQHRGSGLYNIVNLGSGLALDVEGANMTAASNVLQYSLNGGKNQLWGIVLNADKKTYTIYSALNGLALDVHGASIANGSNIETYYPNGGHNQKFFLESVTENYSGVYNVYSRLSQESKAVDVPGNSYANGTQLALWSDNQQLNQRYLFEKVGSAYSIRPVSSGKYLTVTKDGKVVQTSAQGAAGKASSNQLWNVSFARDGFQIRNVGAGKALSVAGAKAVNSAKVQTATWNGSLSQKFLVHSCEFLPRGLYTMTSAANAGLAIDASGASFSNGTNAIVWKSSDTNNQKFAMTPVGGGYYRITLALGGTVLGATGGNGASVKLYNWSGADSQLWKPVLVDGGFTLQNKGTGMRLAAAGKNSGSDVVQQRAAGTDVQKWRISKGFINQRDMGSFVNCLNLASGSSGLTASRAIIGFSSSSSQWKALRNALASCWNAGIDVGFLAVDCNTGMAASVNADRNYFGASTIKGLYVTYLCEELLENGWLSYDEVKGLMHDAIVYSDNDAYRYLRAAYGSQAGFNAWLAKAGVGGLDLWDTYSSRTLAKAWTHMLEYENSGGRYVGFWRSIFNHSDMSVIKDSLGGYRTVYSKPGWMEGGWSGTILNDAGIVKNGDRTYIFAVMTTAYPYNWQKGRVEGVVRAVDSVFSSMAVCR